MSDLKPKPEEPDWDDAGWEEDRLQYEADILRSKQVDEGNAHPPKPLTQTTTASVDDAEDDGPPIPFPLRDQLEYFPAFIARSALFQAGRPGGCDESELRRIPAQKNYESRSLGLA